MSSALLQASRLSIGYPPALIASDINWMVQEKEVVAVLGLNGAGKTTLLRTLAGLQAPVAGEVH
ncbi:MAG TPA: ABC transporter ATP-binding protein, partial [Bacteroidetes bacterium]|nr:ABC transporter ATP-binding protein [Bacteroidota bacterium]